MSHVERSVICLHCQKVHNSGFIWKFSETLRVCFTCYRVMGEDGRKKYERDAAKGESKKAEPQTVGSEATESQTTESKGTGSAGKVLGILLGILGAGARFLSKSPTGKTAEQRL